MNSKLLFVALLGLFFQGVMTGTLSPNSEGVKAATNESAIGEVVIGSTKEAATKGVDGSAKAEATNGGNKTEGRVGIEYTSPSTLPVTTPTSPTTKSTMSTTTAPPTTNSTTSTTTAPPTTKSTTSTSTASPTTNSTTSTTKAPPTTTTTGKNTPTPKPEPVPTEASSKDPGTTAATVTQTTSFDAPNFIGGIVLTLGLTAIGFVSYKFYKARKAGENYKPL